MTIQAQETIILGDQFNNFLQDALITSDNNLVTAGETKSIFSKDVDALMYITDMNGKVIKKKTIGAYDNDYVNQIMESPNGSYILIGHSAKVNQLSDKPTQYWVKGIHPFTLEEEWHLDLPSSTIVTSNVQYEPKTNLFQVIIHEKKNTRLLSFDPKGVVLEEQSIPGLDQMNPNQLFLMTHEDRTIISGLNEIYTDRNVPFITLLRKDLSKQRTVTFPDHNFSTISRIRTIGDRIYLIGSIFNRTTRTDLAVLSIGTDLIKKDGRFTSFTGPGDDHGIDIIDLNDRLMVAGQSTSHKRGARKSNFMVIELNSSNQKFKEPHFFGDQFEERTIAWLRDESNIYLIGQKDDGSVFSENYNYYVNKFYSDYYTEKPSSNKTSDNISDCSISLESGIEDITSNMDQFDINLRFNNTIPNGRVSLSLDHSDFFNYKSSINYYGQENIAYPVYIQKKNNKNDVPVTYEMEFTSLDGSQSCAIKGTFTYKKSSNTDLQIDLLTEGSLLKGQTNTLEFRVTALPDIAKDVIIFLQANDGIASSRREWEKASILAKEELVINTDITIPFDHKDDQLFIDLFYTCLDCPNQSNKKKFSIPLKNQEVKEEVIPSDQWMTIEWRNQYNDTIYSINESFDISAFALSNSEIKPDRLFLYHNDKATNLTGTKFDEKKLTRKKVNSTNKVDISFNLQLKEGLNNVYLAYQDEKNEYQSESIYIDYQLEDKPKLFVLSVGVPDASDQGLRYTQKDAEDFGNLFQNQRNKIFGEVQVDVLSEKYNTTAIEITNQLAEYTRINRLNKITPKDLVILFISSHGVYEDDAFFLQSTGYVKNNKKKTAVDFNEDVLSRLEELNCNSIVFLDACKSGQIQDNFSGRKSDLSGYSYSAAINKLSSSKKGVSAITSSSADEYSYEDIKWENGAFTKGIEDILTDPDLCAQLDKDNDRALSLNEIHDHLRNRVSKMVKKEKKSEQHPSIHIRSEDLGDIPFYAY